MTEVQMRDGSVVDDVRFGRLKSFSPKSRAYALGEVLETERLDTKPLRSYTWDPRLTLDQDGTGGCVSWTLGYDLAARPVAVPGVTDEQCLLRYWRIQERDDWPGSARPGDSPLYEGTSMRAGADQMIAEGWYSRYVWADQQRADLAVRQVQLTLGYRGPVPIGFNWHEGMDEPDSDGFIHPTGRIRGGHSILAIGISLKLGAVKLKQSWGERYAKPLLLAFADLERLLDEEGEAYSPTRIRAASPN